MGNEYNYQFLSRTLMPLFPEVFFHPLWMDFCANGIKQSLDLSFELFLSARQLQSIGDIECSCQVLLICAALQKQSGNNHLALNNIQRAWTLAKKYELAKISRWAVWGASAMCLIQNSDQQAAKYLNWLQDDLYQNGDWVSANVVNMIKMRILDPTQSSDSMDITLEWLKKWGLVLPNEIVSDANFDPTRYRENVQTKNISQNGWRRFLCKLKRLINRTPSLNWEKSQQGSTVKSLIDHETSPSHKQTVLLSGDSLSLSNDYRLLFHQKPTKDALDPLSLKNPNISTLAMSSGKYSLVVYCLGEFHVYQNDLLIENWSSKKGLSVFKYIITHRNTSVNKEILMDTFWPEADLESSRRNLHQAIYALRQTLNQSHPNFQYIEFWNDCYRLNPELEVWIDCEEFEKHIERGQQLESENKTTEAACEYSLAEGLYQDTFLIDNLYEEWCQAYRHDLWQKYLFVARQLSNYYFERNEYVTVIALNRRILTKESCQEIAHQYLIRCFLAQGQRHLALNQYRFCVQALKNELDLPPSNETQELYKLITKGG